MNIVKHIIIDIETLGRRNDAAITQVGIVIADETFSVLDKYLIQISPEAWNTCNRTFTGETLLWWMEQKNSPISNIGAINTYSSYYAAMSVLNGIFKRYNTDDTIVWTKGTLDLFCIKDLCEYLNMSTPWKFWQPRDIRTAKEVVKDWTIVKNDNMHDALADALTELEELKLNLVKE